MKNSNKRLWGKSLRGELQNRLLVKVLKTLITLSLSLGHWGREDGFWGTRMSTLKKRLVLSYKRKKDHFGRSIR